MKSFGNLGERRHRQRDQNDRDDIDGGDSALRSTRCAAPRGGFGRSRWRPSKRDSRIIPKKITVRIPIVSGLPTDGGVRQLFQDRDEIDRDKAAAADVQRLPAAAAFFSGRHGLPRRGQLADPVRQSMAKPLVINKIRTVVDRAGIQVGNGVCRPVIAPRHRAPARCPLLMPVV